MRSSRAISSAAVAAVALTAAALAPGAHAAAPTYAKGWSAPVLVSGTKAARETSVAYNPARPSELLACDPSGVPDTSDGQSYFHYSQNSGRTWRYMKVETSLTDTRSHAYEGGDCDVAFDAGGTMYSADTWLGDLSVGHSTDHGQSWSGTALAGSSPVIDRPWLVGGPKGTVYLSYQDLQCCTPSAIWFTKSTDYGQTFSPAVSVTTATAGGVGTWEGNPVVSPDGKDVYLVYTRRQGTIQNLTSDAETVWVATSHDGGASWTQNKVLDSPVTASYLYPSIALDAGGMLHVVYAAASGKDTPIWYSSSTDKAASWSAPVALMRGMHGYGPWIAAGKSGVAAVTWLGTPDPGAAADDNKSHRWFFYTARVTHLEHGKLAIKAGATTSNPVWEGAQTMPEFEMIRLDKQGLMHIGMSIFVKKGTWGVYYQSEQAKHS